METFRFGFDIPNAPSNVTSTETSESPSENGARTAATSSPPPAPTTTTSKPALSVLDIPSSLSRIAQNTVESDAVPLLSHGREIRPLRKVVLPPANAYAPPPPAAAASTGTDTDRAADAAAQASVDTDLVPGVYEGGLKVWECSLDLCNYLADCIGKLPSSEGMNDCRAAETMDNDCRMALSRNGKALELGCGHGLPGCLILREMQKRWGMEGLRSNNDDDGFAVLFSDFNKFVLRDATLPNIALNSDLDDKCGPSSWSLMQSCVGCVAGDWMDLSERLQHGTLASPNGVNDVQESPTTGDNDHSLCLPSDGRFDLILAAETTYTSKSAKETAFLLGRHLRVGTGVGLIATKRYYFGVGGGADAFRAAASKEVVKAQEHNCRLSVETILEYDSGTGNIRELLRAKLTI